MYMGYVELLSWALTTEVLRLAELLEVDVLAEPLVPLLKLLLPTLRQAHQEGRLEEDG